MKVVRLSRALFWAGLCSLCLGRWLSSAAETPTRSAVPAAESAVSVDEKWWSLRPLVSPPVPQVATTSAINPLDRFVASQLANLGLNPSPPADRRTLIRRVTFDLIGLPSSPEEVEEFVADPRADAYEELVD